MKTISYYISDYGYGHAARSIAIIRSLLEKDDQVRLFICTSFPMEFIRESLIDQEQARIEYRTIVNDMGYLLQNNSIYMDKQKMNEAYDQYVNSMPDYLEQEGRFLKKEKVDLILSDISPWPFILGRKLGIPSIGISNFTWYTAYQGIIEDKKLDPLYEAYRQMDYFIPLAGVKEPAWGKVLYPCNEYFCRSIRNDEVTRIKNKMNPDGNRVIIYFGLGMMVSMEDWLKLKLFEQQDCLIIVSNHMEISHPNVIRIPRCYTESQHYIAASDVVITKAGWSTIGEAVQMNKPLIIVDRSEMSEDRNTINFLKARNRCKILSWNELKEFTFDAKTMLELRNHAKRNPSTSNQLILDKIVDCLNYILHEKKKR